jgi:hypothetical protein
MVSKRKSRSKTRDIGKHLSAEWKKYTAAERKHLSKSQKREFMRIAWRKCKGSK